jgi:hypothetical protein
MDCQIKNNILLCIINYIKSKEQIARELGLLPPTKEDIEKELAEMYAPMTEWNFRYLIYMKTLFLNRCRMHAFEPIVHHYPACHPNI